MSASSGASHGQFVHANKTRASTEVRVKILALISYCEKRCRPVPSNKRIGDALGEPLPVIKSQFNALHYTGAIELVGGRFFRVLDDSILEGAPYNG